MKAEAALLTLDDYAALQDEDEYVDELVRGVVVREPLPSRLHAQVQVEMVFHLRVWAKPRGAEVTAESGYVLAEDPPTLRGPDVAVVVDPRSREIDRHGWVRGAPDVAVEVLSPSNRSSDMHQKTLEYFEAGARLVWLVDPAVRTVTIYRSDGTARVLREHETLEGEDVLVGFSVALAELFGAPTPDPR